MASRKPLQTPCQWRSAPEQSSPWVCEHRGEPGFGMRCRPIPLEEPIRRSGSDMRKAGAFPVPGIILELRKKCGGTQAFFCRGARSFLFGYGGGLAFVIRLFIGAANADGTFGGNGGEFLGYFRSVVAAITSNRQGKEERESQQYQQDSRLHVLSRLLSSLAEFGKH